LLVSRFVFPDVRCEEEIADARDAVGETNVIRKRDFSRAEVLVRQGDNGSAGRKAPVKLGRGNYEFEVSPLCPWLFRILNMRCGEINKSTRL